MKVTLPDWFDWEEMVVINTMLKTFAASLDGVVSELRSEAGLDDFRFTADDFAHLVSKTEDYCAEIAETEGSKYADSVCETEMFFARQQSIAEWEEKNLEKWEG